MHAIHFLTLGVVRGRQGWVAPVELSDETHQSGTLTAPVDANGKLFERYDLECLRYLGQGNTQSASAVLELELDPSGGLAGLVDGSHIRFRLRTVAGKPVVREYVGSLSHPDFACRLAEIEPESEQQLDELYTLHRIVLAGCDPAANYSGLECLA